MESFKNEDLLAKDLLHSRRNNLLFKLLGFEDINSADEFIDQVAKRMIEIQNESSKNANEFYTSKEICIIYKISLATLERWIRKGLKYESTGAKSKRLFTRKNIDLYKTKKR